jgi:predicted RNase H-like HicB family nuclease
MSELIFEVTQESDGGFVAECLTESIVTEGDTWEQLRAKVQEAVRGFWFDAPANAPRQIRLRLVRDEVLATA